MYREFRGRQVINMTPYLLLQNDVRRADPALRGAQLLHGIATHRHAVLNGTLEIDRERGKPMDMRQYELLYGSARIPAPGRDKLTVDREARHVIVMRRHRFYAVDIVNTKHEPRSEADIAADLRAVTAHADARSYATPVAVLSAGNRDTWARNRDLLRKSAINCEALDAIDRAIYVLALDV